MFCYADAAGRVADFHALRHGFITGLARGGVHPKDAQSLARHSSITLTMDRYTHIGIRQFANALDALPALPPMTGPDTEAAELPATGTDGRTDPSLVALMVALKTDQSCPPVSSSDPEGIIGLPPENMKKPAKTQGFRGFSISAPPGTRTQNPLIKSQML